MHTVNSLYHLHQSSHCGQFKVCYTSPVYCFCVQGIALSADTNYKVLGAAYPWIARRLLTEQSPELRDTLRTLLYKKGRFQASHKTQDEMLANTAA